MADALLFETAPVANADAYWWRISYQDDGTTWTASSPGPKIQLPATKFPPGQPLQVQVETVHSTSLEVSGWGAPLHMVPEPSASLLLVAGLAGLITLRRLS